VEKDPLIGKGFNPSRANSGQLKEDYEEISDAS